MTTKSRIIIETTSDDGRNVRRMTIEPGHAVHRVRTYTRSYEQRGLLSYSNQQQETTTFPASHPDLSDLIAAATAWFKR